MWFYLRFLLRKVTSAPFITFWYIDCFNCCWKPQTHFAELHREFDLLYFQQSVLDHLLNISLDSFHLRLLITTKKKTKLESESKIQSLPKYLTEWWCNDDEDSGCSPSSSCSLAPLGRWHDRGGQSQCTAHTHTSGRSCRTAPGAVGAFYNSDSPALPLVQSACESSGWKLSGVAPGDSHNMKSDTQGRTLRPLFSSPHTRHKILIFLALEWRHSAFLLGSALTSPWQRSFHKAPGGPQRQSDILDIWWRGCRSSVMWCRWSRSCGRRGWTQVQRKHPDRCSTETAPLTWERWERPWPVK